MKSIFNINNLLLNFIFILLICSLPIIAHAQNSQIQQPRVALVLGGGGARGLAHLGVLQVLEKAGVPIDLIVGTSAGSIVGACYADNPNAAAVTNLLMNAPSSQILDFSLLHLAQGPFNGAGLESFIDSNLHAQQISQLKIKFIAVATDLQTGQTVQLVNGPVGLAVRSSSALPPFFGPAKWNNQLLVDGGITDPVPVDTAKLYHPKIIIAVSIAKEVPPYTTPHDTLEVYHRTQLITKEHFDALSAKGADIVIYPDVAQAGTFSTSEKDKIALVQAGQEAAELDLPKICELLKKNHIQSKCK